MEPQPYTSAELAGLDELAASGVHSCDPVMAERLRATLKAQEDEIAFLKRVHAALDALEAALPPQPSSCSTQARFA